MRKSIVLIVLSLLIFAADLAVVFGQKRLVVKPKSTAAKPKTVEKTEAATASPALTLFNDGLKCAKEDYDCQISNYTKAINLNLNTKEVFQNRGNAYLQRKDFDKAIADFTKVIELDLNDASGYKNRGRIYLENSTAPQIINAAIRDFTSAIDLEPKDVEAYRLRSRAYFALGMNEKATNDLEKSLVLNPRDAQANMNNGLTYVQLNNYEKAVEAFGKAIDLNPRNADVFEIRGKSYLKLGKIDLAIRDINKAKELDPKRSGLIDVAKALESQKKYKEAIDILDIIRTSNSDLNISEYLYKRASLNFLAKNYEAMIPDLTKAIEINPRNAKAYEARCKAFFSLKDYQSAFEDCSDAIEIDEGLDEAYFSRGSANYQLSKNMNSFTTDHKRGYSNMVANANRILAQNPEDYNALVKRGNGYNGLENANSALADFTAAIKIRPGSTEAYVSRGAIYGSRLNNWSAAIADFNSIIKLEPASSTGYYYRAWANSAQKNYAAEKEDREKLVELDPSNEDAYIMLYFAHFSSVGYEAKDSRANFGVQVYSRGITANPGSVSLYSHRAGSYEELGDYKSAINDYNKAIELATADKTKLSENTVISIFRKLNFIYSLKLKDNATAVSSLNKGLEIFPKSLEIKSVAISYYKNVITDLILKRDYRGAIDNYATVPELFSNDNEDAKQDFAYATRWTAKAYLYLKDKTNAFQTIDKGLAMSPNNKYMYEMAGEIYKEAGDSRKATHYLNTAAQMGSDSASRTLGNIAEEKQRRRERRNAAILGVMGAVNQTLETYNNSRQNTPTSQPTQPNTSSRPQTTQSGGTSTTVPQTNGNSGSTVTDCNDGITRGGTGFDCHQFVTSGHIVRDESTRAGYWEDTCKNSICSQWAQTPLSQIYFRGKLGINESAAAKKYVWTIGFKNTSNSVVVFFPELIYGDGTTQPGDGVALTPGSETVWHVTWGTNFGSSEVSIRMRKYAICSNISRITDNGSSGYKCN